MLLLNRLLILHYEFEERHQPIACGYLTSSMHDINALFSWWIGACPLKIEKTAVNVSLERTKDSKYQSGHYQREGALAREHCDRPCFIKRPAFSPTTSYFAQFEHNKRFVCHLAHSRILIHATGDGAPCSNNRSACRHDSQQTFIILPLILSQDDELFAYHGTIEW